VALPDSRPALVGREPELAAIARAIADDAPIVVVGEAGIGKTSLVRGAGVAVRSRGRPLR
jgi:MoxR-like ATPase